MKAAGYTYLWKRDDNERSVFNNNALASKMQERFPPDHPTMAGQFAWTATEPLTPAKRGTTLCPLHPNRPERPLFDQLGYPSCPGDHYRNEYDAELHLQSKHRDTYRMISKSRDEAVANKATQGTNDVMTMLAKAIAGQAIDMPPQPNQSEPIVGNDTQTETDTNIWEYTNIPEEPKKHVHLYGKAMGAPCKVKGCHAVRITPFKARNRHVKN